MSCQEHVSALIGPPSYPGPRPGPKIPDNTPTSSTSISVDVNDGTINSSTHSDYMESIHTLVESSTTAPTLGTSATGLEIQTSEGKAALTYSASRTDSQIPFVSGSGTSLLSLSSPATAAPALPGTPATLTVGGNAMTANTFAHFNINNQSHRPDGAITASGTMISLTPDQSDVVVGTHTGVSGANLTAGLASGPKTTGAQTFKGTAVGAKDEFCNSSMVMLIVIAILLWLR